MGTGQHIIAQLDLPACLPSAAALARLVVVVCHRALHRTVCPERTIQYVHLPLSRAPTPRDSDSSLSYGIASITGVVC